MVVYDGYGLVNNANSVTIVPSGSLRRFPDLSSHVGASGYDGDFGIHG